MSEKLRKREKSFIYQGFGFPVELRNVPMIQVRGEWTPDVNYDELSATILEALAFKPARLTGNEVHFIRSSFDMTLIQFAKRFDVTHPAVLKWEKAGDSATPMTWSTEKDIRLAIFLHRQKLATFAQEYMALEKRRPDLPQPTPSFAPGADLGAMLKSTEWKSKISQEGTGISSRRASQG